MQRGSVTDEGNDESTPNFKSVPCKIQKHSVQIPYNNVSL